MKAREIWARGLTASDRGKVIELDDSLPVVIERGLLQSVDWAGADATLLTLSVTVEVTNDRVVRVYE